MYSFIDWSEKIKSTIYRPINLEGIKVSHDYEITDELFDECYQTAARLVRIHGEKYLPIFERMHQEKERRKEKKSLLKQAYFTAQKNTP